MLLSLAVMVQSTLHFCVHDLHFHIYSERRHVLSVTDGAGPSGQQSAAPTAGSGRSLRSRQITAAHAAASQSLEPNEDAAAEGAARESVSQAGPRAEPEAEAEEAADRAVGGKSLEELAVRFSQATKELQACACARLFFQYVLFFTD